MEHRAARSRKGAEVRGQRSGVKLISDLRLLTSVRYDFNGLNGFYGFNDLPFTVYRLLRPAS
jgi:hypothetical protein